MNRALGRDKRFLTLPIQVLSAPTGSPTSFPPRSFIRILIYPTNTSLALLPSPPALMAANGMTVHTFNPDASPEAKAAQAGQHADKLKPSDDGAANGRGASRLCCCCCCCSTRLDFLPQNSRLIRGTAPLCSMRNFSRHYHRSRQRHRSPAPCPRGQHLLSRTGTK